MCVVGEVGGRRGGRGSLQHWIDSLIPIHAQVMAADSGQHVFVSLLKTCLRDTIFTVYTVYTMIVEQDINTTH